MHNAQLIFHPGKMRQAKIDYFDGSIIRNQYIARMDVGVDYALRMQPCVSFQDRAADIKKALWCIKTC